MALGLGLGLGVPLVLLVIAVACLASRVLSRREAGQKSRGGVVAKPADVSVSSVSASSSMSDANDADESKI